MTTLKQAFQSWEQEIKPAVIEQYGTDDEPALSESWNNYTDMLCKDGELSALQYHHCPAWDDPMPYDDEEDRGYLLACMGIEFTALEVASRPDGLMDEIASHWLCAIYHGSKTFTLYFSQGGKFSAAPELAEVLAAVLLDWASFEEVEDFEEFCVASCYNEDADSLRQGRKVYTAIKTMAGQLTAMFTLDELAQIQSLVEDL